MAAVQFEIIQVESRALINVHNKHEKHLCVFVHGKVLEVLGEIS